MWIAGAEDEVQIEDRITVIGQRADIRSVADMFQRKADPKLGVVIAGGGETGYHLSRILEDRRYAITLMESDPSRVLRHREESEASIPTAQDIEQWRKQAEEEGFQQGLVRAQQEAEELRRRLLQLIDFFEHPLQSLNY